MRLHHLEVTAFGPFASTATIDFEALTSSGLFLLSGATGAGKTSVLDAVCFALYGDVPGDRSSAKRLRSDHAAPGEEPRVVLEVTLSGRRFRFSRSPAWERPKKRGEGTTPQQSKVVLQERRDGAWQTLSTRIDEVGDLVRSVLGMNLTQFCQVAMLPQGRFQAFLRARSDERQVLLQQLFGTERFTRVEHWLRDRRLTLHRRVRVHHDEVAALVNRFSEAAERPCPDDWDLRALESPTDDGTLDSWVATALGDLDQQLLTCQARLEDVGGDLAAAQDDLRSARTTADRQERFRAAQEQHDGLLARTSTHRARTDELDRARRAGSVEPLHRVVEATRGRLADYRRQGEELRSRLAGLGHLVPVEDSLAALRSLQVDVTGRLHALAPVLRVEASVADRAARLRTLQDDLASVLRERDDQADRLARLPAERTAIQESLGRTQEAAHRLAAAESEVQTLGRQLSSRHEAQRLAEDLQEAEDQRRAYQDRAQASVQEWLDLREARLSGMAAEIAGDLAAGCHCPVCGSAEHPRPATPVPGAPDATAERRAQRRADDARAVLAAHDDQVQQLRTRLEVARSTATTASTDELTTRLAEAEQRLVAGRDAQGRLDELRRTVEALESQERQGLEQLRALDRRVTDLESRIAAATTELEESRREVAEALAGSAQPSVAALTTHLEHLAQALSVAVSAQESHDLLAAELAGHEAALAAAVLDHGFASLPDALDACRSHDEQLHLQRLVDEHDEQLTRVAAVLDDPDLRDAAAQPEPDLPALDARLSRLATECESLKVRAESTSRALGRCQALATELADALTRWRPVREEHATVAGLAALVEGKSVDNRLQMRLSAYVLGYRLSQVVAAANVRLGSMSDQRYTLEHTGRRGAGETRGGLTLAVVDEWSGLSRDPATLSGGETFIVSLALALGLADVISQEAGGTELHTLFVDEGFGSLDADSLDMVLDTLDSLRDGGRSVGVVSHVTEMAERIPIQLRVHKSRHGSTVSLVGAAC